MEPQQPSGLEIQARLIGRAAIDPNFREQLLTNSRAAIEKELGITLPPNLEIQVVEETPTKLCLVLPMKQETQQLSEAELKAVAGGTDTLTPEELLRFEVVIQREQRTYTMLSNIMKTQSSTQSTIIQNIK